jgi:hypothetical protein
MGPELEDRARARLGDGNRRLTSGTCPVAPGRELNLELLCIYPADVTRPQFHLAFGQHLLFISSKKKYIQVKVCYVILVNFSILS